MVYPIVVYGSPLLRRISEDISPDYPDLGQLIGDMFETMVVSDGVGLAAPQIGKSIRLFVIDASPMADENPSLADFRKVFINPRILEEKGDKWLFVEGCLSIPELREEVLRPGIVTLEYYDENFTYHKETYDGVKARIIQHEYDHLDGVLFVDKVSPLKKKLIKGKLGNIAKGKVQAAYKTKLLK
ncbi:MAG: peptide deformylase [Bacteroidota bacterium]|nr:MAG: peptide deformylase [Bacteroidota bacterium]